jgi:hypothetical protein
MLLVSSVQLLRTVNDLNSLDSGVGNVPRCDSYNADFQCRKLVGGVVSIFT